MDLWAVGDKYPVEKRFPSFDVLLDKYMSHAAWYGGLNGYPLLSIFSSGGLPKNSGLSGEGLKACT